MQYDLEIMQLVERLRQTCSCVNCEDDSVLQSYLSRFISILSRSLCWVDGQCGSFLKSLRREIIPVDGLQFCGCTAIMEVKPFYYKQLDYETLSITIQQRKGIKLINDTIDPDMYSIDLDGTLLIDLTKWLSPCCKCVNPCECETTYKLILEYEAGYTSETLPECVLDAFCHLLNIFIAYNNKCGSLDDCSNLDNLAVGAVLKQKSVDYIVREWVIDETDFNRVSVKLLNKWYLNTISALSLCQRSDFMYAALGKDKKC